VQVGTGVMNESAEEIFEQFGLQIADEADFDPVLIYKGWTSSEINRDHCQRFIHRQYKIPGSVDAFAIAEGLGKQLADHNADVFHGVVLIDVEIAFGSQLEIEGAVFGEEFKHVIEEADAGRDFVASAAFDAQLAANLSFFGVSLESRCSGQGRPPGS
jgi:hypothetical protein